MQIRDFTIFVFLFFFLMPDFSGNSAQRVSPDPLSLREGLARETSPCTPPSPLEALTAHAIAHVPGQYMARYSARYNPARTRACTNSYSRSPTAKMPLTPQDEEP